MGTTSASTATYRWLMGERGFGFLCGGRGPRTGVMITPQRLKYFPRTGQHERAAQLAFRHAIVRQGIRPDLIERVHGPAGCGATAAWSCAAAGTGESAVADA